MLTFGQLVDRYRVEALLGQGGMATVYRVRHTQLDADRALKVISVLHPATRRRLLQEGRLQASLDHENVVSVTDVLEVAGAPALLMEYVPGPSLQQWLQRHQPSLPEALSLYRAIVSGVAYAHRKGLVHRDLKPANVMVVRRGDRVVPKVADFGLAKVVADELGGSGSTRTGTGMGTPAYMAPEQIRDAKRVDQRADVFALGCILYELVCGQRAFPGDDLLTLLTAINASDYQPPRDLRPDIPMEIEATILGCLVSDRDQRLPDCAAILESLPPLQPVTWTPGALDAAATPAETSLAPSADQTPVDAAAMEGTWDPAAGAQAQASSDTWAPGPNRGATQVPSGSAVDLAGGVPGDSGRAASALEDTLEDGAAATGSPLTTGSQSSAEGLGPWKLVATLAAVIAVIAVAWVFVGPGAQPDATVGDLPQAASSLPGAVQQATQPTTPSLTPGGDDAAPLDITPQDAADPADSSPTAQAPTQPIAATATAAPTPAATASASSVPVAPTAPAATEAAPETATEDTAQTGMISVTGDAERVVFKGSSGSFPPGSMPAGSYEIMATFPGRAPAAAGQVTVTPGLQVQLRCTAAFVKCVQ